MIFYFNNDMNICADENWVVDYLILSGAYDNRREARKDLHEKREVNGWFCCEVCDNISNAMKNRG